MTTKAQEDYAIRHNLSYGKAKRALRRKGKKSASAIIVQRGAPIPGTGKPKKG